MNGRLSEDVPGRVLIVLLGAIGDVVRALPLAHRIKRAWPETHLAWAIEPKSVNAVLGHPSVDQVLLFDRPGGFLAYCSFLREVKQGQFDVVLDLQRHLKSGVTSFYSRAPRRIGYHKRNAKEYNWLFQNEQIDLVEEFSPKILQYQKFGDALGLEPLDGLDFAWEVSAEELASSESKLKGICDDTGIEVPSSEKRALLIVGSSWPSRFWFPEYVRALALKLKERWGLTSIVVGSSQEIAFSDEVFSLEALRGCALNFVGKTSLRELAALCSQARLAVAVDSGPMHIASALGLPVVSLWGSTSPLRSAPYGSEHLVLQSPIACSPCFKSECPGLGRLCMKDIPLAAVLAQVARVIDN